MILYTSGTTGQPKGAELRHRNMRDNALMGADLFGADESRPDTYLCVLPLFHSFGQTVIQNGAFAYGGTIVMLPRFEAQAAVALQRWRFAAATINGHAVPAVIEQTIRFTIGTGGKG